MANVVVEEQSLIDIANAIRTQNGTTDTYKPSEMANAISNIETGITPTGTLEITENGTYDVTNYANVNVANDTSEIEDVFITHTLSGDYTNDRVTTIPYGTFYGDTELTGVSFPEVTSADGYSFYKCTSLATIDIPKLKTSASYTFAYTKPSNINFPLLETMSTYTFAYITVPCTVNLPSLKATTNSGFRDSKGITRVDLGSATKIDTLCFYYCNNLEKLILRKSDAICTLQSTNAFTGTKIAGGTGYVYVPRALLSDDDATKDYRRATNWSNYSTQFRVLEDYTVDGTITGELDLNKI